MAKKVSMVTLGCFRNTYDSSVIAQSLRRKGYVVNGGVRGAKLLVINTCGFIDQAKEESLQTIEEAARLKKQGHIERIIVVGCLVQRYRDELVRHFPSVDEFRGVVEFKQDGAEHILDGQAHYLGFLKIAEGCGNHCSYCTIPQIKGELISKRVKAVLEEAQYFDRRGIKEMNIIGQDITSWGKDLYKNKDLAYLVAKILKETNIPWIRLLYTHPKNFTDSLIEVIAGNERICRYIDLPIQHINNRLLKLMNRGTRKREILRLIEKIRTRIPGCTIRTSVIVGLPTETEDDFNELLSFVKEVKFEKLGAFTYSREEQTPAYDLEPQVPQSTKQRRFRQLMSLQQDISRSLNERFLGKELDVLVEESNEAEHCIGRTQFDAHQIDGVVFIRGKKLRAGEFARAKITDTLEYDLAGEAL